MKRMAQKMSRKSDKKEKKRKPSSSSLSSASPFSLPNYAWQGEQTSILDGAYAKHLPTSGGSSAAGEDKSSSSRERRYGRQRALPSADNMLMGDLVSTSSSNAAAEQSASAKATPLAAKKNDGVQQQPMQPVQKPDTVETSVPAPRHDVHIASTAASGTVAAATGLVEPCSRPTDVSAGKVASLDYDDRTPTVSASDDRTPTVATSHSSDRLPCISVTDMPRQQLAPVVVPAAIEQPNYQTVEKGARRGSGSTSGSVSGRRGSSSTSASVSRPCSVQSLPDPDSSLATADDGSETGSILSASTGRSQDMEVVHRLLERVSQLERRNQQLAFEVDQLNTDKKLAEGVSAIADKALLQWKTLEAETKEEISALKERVSVSDLHVSSLEKRNADLTEQLTKSINGNASLKQRLQALGETVSRSSSPAWNNSQSSSPALQVTSSNGECAVVSRVAAELDAKSKEIAQLQEQHSELQQVLDKQREEDGARIAQLEEEVKDTQTERLLAERMYQRQQQQNEQLVREKAALVTERASRQSSTASPNINARNTAQVKQLESLVQFVGSQLPSKSANARQSTPSDSPDLTAIRQQVVFAKQRLLSADKAAQSLATSEQRLDTVRSELKESQRAKDQSDLLLQTERAKFETSLASKSEELLEVESRLADLQADKEKAESQVLKFEAQQGCLPDSQQVQETKQQLLTLRQDRAQLRVELRHLQKQEKGQKATITELNANKEELSMLLSAAKEDLQAVKTAHDEKLQLLTESKSEEISVLSNALQNELVALREENTQLNQELAALKASEHAAQLELSRLFADHDALKASGQRAATELSAAQCEIADLRSKTASLNEQVQLVNLHNASLKEELDSATATYQTSSIDEILQAERDKLQETLHSVKEQLSDRGTMVRELKQQNEQLYDKYQQEMKRARELSDAVDSARKQLSHKEVELQHSQDELRDINAAIDEMEQLPRANRALQEEIQALRSENKVLKTSRFNEEGSRPLEGKELDQACRQMEWRLMQLEPKQEQWRHDREELDQLRRVKQRQELQLGEATEEVSMLRLHNQQIRLLQEQFTSKSNEVSYQEEENRQLQRELREVELEVAVWKEKANRSMQERAMLIDQQREHTRIQQHTSGADSHYRHVQTLQERILTLEEQKSNLASRAMDGAQRQQRLSSQVQSLEAVKLTNTVLEDKVIELKRALDEAQQLNKTLGNGSHATTDLSRHTVGLNGHGGVPARRNGNVNGGSPVIVRSSDTDDEEDCSEPIPSGYELMNDFTSTDSLDSEAVVCCREHTAGNLSEAAEETVRKYWFKVTDQTGDINTTELGQLLYMLAVTSEDLLRRVVNYVANNGNTALHYLILRGQLLAAWLLLQTGQCKVDTRNKFGYTPCMMLCGAPPGEVGSNQFVVKKLFELADINLQAAQDGQTALMMAVHRSNRVMVELLLNTGQCQVNLQDMDGSTALMFASESGEEDIVRLILAREDCDVNIKDHDENTALQIALEKTRRGVSVLLYAALVYGKHKNDVQSA
eukprot:scpid10474/ scgid4491/ KN motif and ankyrin repeat domain-containing protein 1; Ankyrin repeat domain-containing protein 15; Kidney ankyrin repeat-containing protein